MSGNDVNSSGESRIGWFLMVVLAALLIYAGVTAHGNVALGPIRPPAGKSAPAIAGQAMLGGVFLEGPVTVLLLLAD